MAAAKIQTLTSDIIMYKYEVRGRLGRTTKTNLLLCFNICMSYAILVCEYT